MYGDRIKEGDNEHCELAPRRLAGSIASSGVRDVVFCSTWADEPTPEKRQQGEDVAWTAIIPDAFPQDIYKWRLMADGAYTEDGFNRTTGATIQPTLSGRWTTKGTRMFLRQDGIHYVFDGKVVADPYEGTLYLGDERVSNFCALKGNAPPDNCDVQDVQLPAALAATDTVGMTPQRARRWRGRLIVPAGG